MRLRFLNSCLIVFVVCVLSARPANAVDTDGDGLLDLIDVPGFDQSATGYVMFPSFLKFYVVEDLDGANLLTNLDGLGLGGNQITSIESGDFDGLTNLQTLELNFNQITSLESGDFDGLTNLQLLYLSDNQIVSIEEGAFEGLTNLEYLDMWNNQVTSLESGDFDGLTNLQTLYLNFNQITSIESGDFEGLNNLEYLDLDGNQITSLESGDFDGLANLQILSLYDNQIASIEEGAFEGLTELRQLYLSKNKLTELNLTGATFQNLAVCGSRGGFCLGSLSIDALDLDDAALSLRSFEAIIHETDAVTDVSLVGLTFSDEYPSDLGQFLGLEPLDNVTVDQSFYDIYADEFNAFAAFEGNTVTIVPGLCDVNRDGSCNVADIDAMAQDILAGDNKQVDLTTLIHRPMPHGFGTYLGDANLDGLFNSDDLIGVLAANTYEMQTGADWASGDFNADGYFNSTDLIDALADNGYEKGPRPQPVPEPSSAVLIVMGLVALRRRLGF